MKIVAGIPRINGVYVGEVALDLRTDQVNFVVTAGFIDTSTGRRFGSFTKMGGWSPETLKKLTDFISGLEDDLAADVFGSTTASGDEAIATPIDGVPGL